MYILEDFFVCSSGPFLVWGGGGVSSEPREPPPPPPPGYGLVTHKDMQLSTTNGPLSNLKPFMV